GKVIVGVVCGRSSLLVELAQELVAARRKRIEPGDAFEINEMIRLLRVLESELRRTAPAVRLRAEIGDLSDGEAQKSRHSGRNLLRRNPVDGGVSLVAPCDGRDTLKKDEDHQHHAD